MSKKCEFCGNLYDGKGYIDYFRDEAHPVGDFTVHTYHFCCRGHLDSFLNITTMTECGYNGLTDEEQQILDSHSNQEEDVNRNWYKTCQGCKNEFFVMDKGDGFWMDDTFFCSQECLDNYK